ncbi:hypothetical protein AMECASPLE_024355 [Ameca splendens]|uniref:Uncharacterized protein n=1 Tax=Ameca splendens TaxID=208324 RepID=A0ABV0Z2C0_9TELE
MRVCKYFYIPLKCEQNQGSLIHTFQNICIFDIGLNCFSPSKMYICGWKTEQSESTRDPRQLSVKNGSLQTRMPCSLQPRNTTNRSTNNKRRGPSLKAKRAREHKTKFLVEAGDT